MNLFLALYYTFSVITVPFHYEILYDNTIKITEVSLYIYEHIMNVILIAT